MLTAHCTTENVPGGEVSIFKVFLLLINKADYLRFHPTFLAHKMLNTLITLPELGSLMRYTVSAVHNIKCMQIGFSEQWILPAIPINNHGACIIASIVVSNAHPVKATCLWLLAWHTVLYGKHASILHLDGLIQLMPCD